MKEIKAMNDAKNTNDVKKVDKTDEALDFALCQDYVDQLQKMVDDRDAKCKAAKEQLVENLKITGDKYRTATGVMEALSVLRRVMGDDASADTYTKISIAKGIAITLSETCEKMAAKAEGLGYAEMDQLCDGFYDKEFATKDHSAIEMTEELMHLDLCRNVGPAAEDMVSFLDRVQEQIDETDAKRRELVEKYPVFEKIVPTSKKD